MLLAGWSAKTLGEAFQYQLFCFVAVP